MPKPDCTLTRALPQALITEPKLNDLTVYPGYVSLIFPPDLMRNGDLLPLWNSEWSPGCENLQVQHFERLMVTNQRDAEIIN